MSTLLPGNAFVILDLQTIRRSRARGTRYEVVMPVGRSEIVRITPEVAIMVSALGFPNRAGCSYGH